MIWNVTLDFKKGPSLGPVQVQAPNEVEAIEAAKRDAQSYGFDQPVKRAVALPN